jgi:hypothetical protein
MPAERTTVRHVRRRSARQIGPFEAERFSVKRINPNNRRFRTRFVALLKNASRRELPRFTSMSATTVDTASWIPRAFAIGFAAAIDPQNIEPPASMRVRFA